MISLAPDWFSASAAIIGAITAVVAAYVGLRTFRHQQTTNDVTLALDIFGQINRYWDRAAEPGGGSNYNFGQILAYFEVAAALFNDGVLATQANKILKDHIVEVFSNFQINQSGQKLLDYCKSADTTLDELHKFARANFPEALLAQAFSENRKTKPNEARDD